MGEPIVQTELLDSLFTKVIIRDTVWKIKQIHNLKEILMKQEELKIDSRLLRVLENPKLLSILNYFDGIEQIDHLLLDFEQKCDIKFALNYREDEHYFFNLFQTKIFTPQLVESRNLAFLKILEDANISLEQKMLSYNKSDYRFSHYIYPVPGNSEFDPKHIMFLNPEPECYLFRDKIRNVLQQLGKNGFGGSLVYSLPAKESHWLFRTRQIDAIFHQEGGRMHIKEFKEDVYSEIFKYGGSGFDGFKDYIERLPINESFADMDDFLEKMESCRYSQKRSAV